MNTRLTLALSLIVALGLGCADMGGLGGPRYGETTGAVVSDADRRGQITTLELIKVDDEYKLGIGAAVGAVAGGLLGSRIGGGETSTAGAAVGAAVGAAAGSVIEGRLKAKDAQRVTVRMGTGGQVIIVQPVDSRLANGMSVRVEGSGETARVVPQ